MRQLVVKQGTHGRVDDDNSCRFCNIPHFLGFYLQRLSFSSFFSRGLCDRLHSHPVSIRPFVIVSTLTLYPSDPSYFLCSPLALWALPLLLLPSSPCSPPGGPLSSPSMSPTSMPSAVLSSRPSDMPSMGPHAVDGDEHQRQVVRLVRAQQDALQQRPTEHRSVEHPSAAPSSLPSTSPSDDLLSSPPLLPTAMPTSVPDLSRRPIQALLLR